MTEIPGAFSNPFEGPHKLGAMGRPGVHPDPSVPWTQARILDDDGRDVPGDAVGELVVRIPTLMQGYYPDADNIRRPIPRRLVDDGRSGSPGTRTPISTSSPARRTSSGAAERISPGRSSTASSRNTPALPKRPPSRSIRSSETTKLCSSSYRSRAVRSRRRRSARGVPSAWLPTKCRGSSRSSKRSRTRPRTRSRSTCSRGTARFENAPWTLCRRSSEAGRRQTRCDRFKPSV